MKSLTIICLASLILILTSCKRPLTEKNADKLIPNGMSESEVYTLLGTNASISTGSSGKKYLLYFFQFFPPPPRIDPKVGTMTVIISNGIVIDRQFGIEVKP
jgi:hypothetical protein